MKEQTNKIPQKLDKFIQQQKNVVELNDFHDEDSFNNYLGELINLKKLENQKKFVNF